jgi:regulation of enolase protein 1 (concanavalin A-like superfamily)
MSRILLASLWAALACAAFAADPDPDPEPNSFGAGWDRPVDPDKDCKFKREKGGLTIEVPGKDHDLAAQRLMNSPRLLRDVEGDFVAEVRVGGKFVPSLGATTTERVPFVGAGLVVMADEKNYVRLERAALRRGEVKTYVNWELWQEGRWVLAGSDSVCPLKEKQTYLRVERKGGRLLAWASEDGKAWTELKSLELKMPAKVKLGVAAGTTSTETFAPFYDRFRLKKVKRD